MKKTIKTTIAFILAVSMLSSCYTYTSVVGKGAQGGQAMTHQNHYLIAGLVPLKMSDSKAMSGGASDYDITTTHNILDLIIGIITFGIYTPTTTTVTK
jgi:hypothetical protein